ncbi:hypothetical protein TU73_00330 [Pseudomonas libanensis]|uniref:Uncharacterized protein n=1 Tax=Pseudomonas libanensis TaxID=75588 RepID=A0A0R2YJF5_9PSED|nr:hypothetical protein TU73_00330 [Pseudomonas libanensis]
MTFFAGWFVMKVVYLNGSFGTFFFNRILACRTWLPIFLTAPQQLPLMQLTRIEKFRCFLA